MHQIRFRLGLRARPCALRLLTWLPEVPKLDLIGSTPYGEKEEKEYERRGTGREGRERVAPLLKS